MEIFLSEAKFFFNAKNQQEFTSVTSQASFQSKFKHMMTALIHVGTSPALQESGLESVGVRG